MSMIEFTIKCEPGEFRKILRELLAGEAGAALDSLIPSKAAVTHDPDVGKASPPATPAAAADKPADPKPDAKKAGGARKPKDEPAASGSPAPSPTTSPSQSAPEQSGGASTQPEGAAAAPAPKKDAVASAVGASAAVSGLPDNVRNTTSMRDLLTYLAEHGVDSMDAMVATCVTIQKEVPILAKVPKVDERVRRACEVLQLFPEKPAEETPTA